MSNIGDRKEQMKSKYPNSTMQGKIVILVLFSNVALVAEDRVPCLDYSYRGLDKIEIDDCTDLIQGDNVSACLNVSGNHLEVLPSNLATCNPHIRQVDISNNYFRQIPYRSLGGLHSLEDLNANDNGITSVEADRRLVSLTKLSVSSNSLQEIPKNFFSIFRGLITADFSYNMITEVPCFIGLHGVNISEIDLRNNNLKKLNLDYFVQEKYVKHIIVTDSLMELHIERSHNTSKVLKIFIDNNQETIDCDQNIGEGNRSKLNVTLSQCVFSNGTQGKLEILPAIFTESPDDAITSTHSTSGASTIHGIRVIAAIPSMAAILRFLS
ncbi:uncharacterized protein [Apostichopus japonicus]|uniref:uncharacterized protein isoform X2 n=1 Tax=Stichopus japonicus TaxID=307972 RepID=UPI003AB22807